MRLPFCAVFFVVFNLACVTTSSPGPQEELQFYSLKKLSCSQAGARIFRMTILRNDELLASIDLESGLRSTGVRALVVRGEAMNELLSWDFNQEMLPLGPLEAVFGEHHIEGYSDHVSVDGHSFGLGPGELACLAEGLFPAAWLDDKKLQWDRSLRKFVRFEKARTVLFNSLPGGGLEVDITWPSSWFSKESIHVITFGNSDDVLRGKMDGPHGILMKWVEV